jgi:dihydropteroate synthase
MHMRGTPATMQQNPEYDDVVAEISDFLRQRVETACEAGIKTERICLDPGIGFGKRIEHNLQILARFDNFRKLARPLLVGVSRKSFIGTILDDAPDQRLEGSIAASLAAVMKGANVVRVHDVGPMKRALATVDAIRRSVYNEKQSPCEDKSLKREPE